MTDKQNTFKNKIECFIALDDKSKYALEIVNLMENRNICTKP